MQILRRVNAFFEDTADVQKYVLSGVEKRPVTEAAPLTVFSYERPLFGTIGEIPSAQQQGPSLPASPTAASPGPVPAPTNVVSPKGVPPAASADAKQQQQAPKKNKGGGWLGMSRSRDTRDASDSASVISDITYTDAGVANGSSASRDSYGGDQYGRQSLGPGVVPPSSAGNKKSTAGRYFFGSGTRPGPPSVAGTPAGTPTPMSEPNVTLPSEEHKGEAYGARPLPPPSPVYNRLSLAQPNGTTTGAGAGGIASMDEDSISKRSSTSSIAAVGSGGAADAGAGAGYRNSTGHSISPSRGDGLGLGTARGLTLEVLVAQAKSQSRVRSSQGSRNSDASEDETPMQLQPTKTAPAQRSIFLNQAPTPLHRDASAPHSAAQSPTTSVSTVTPTSNRPPSKDYTARPFSALFFRSTSDKKVGQQGVAPNAAGGPAAASPVISTAPGSAPTGMTQPSATPYSSSSMAPAPSASSGSSAAPMSLASSSASPRTGSGMLAATSPRGGGLGAVKILSRQRAPETMQGKDLVSEDMLEYLVQASVNRAVADNLSKQALKDPKVLFGWQVRPTAFY